MFESILEQVKSIVKINANEEKAFLDALEIKKIKRNRLILEVGQVCNSIIFIKQGCIRYFYMKDGEEMTGQFFKENDWYTDFDSLLTGRPSEQNVQALEDCEYFQLSKTKLDKLYTEFPVFERFGRVMTEHAFLGVRHRNKMSTLLSPEERYISFIKNRAEIVQRIPQHYIASYLGIKPQSLSRIKKRLFQKK